MRSLHLWTRAIRLQHCIAAALGTWVVALLSNGAQWVNAPKVAAPIAMAFCVAGASLYHYGAAREIYVRKSERLWIEFQPRIVLLSAGLGSFGISLLITGLLLNPMCFGLVLFNVLAIILYARRLDRHWITKNTVITTVIASPVLVGWFAGHRMNPMTPWLLGSIAAAYMAREIVKDVDDILANQGRRVTLPMEVGTRGAMRIAGTCAGLSGLMLVPAARYLLGAIPTAIGFASMMLITGRITVQLFQRDRPGDAKHWIFGSSLLLTLTMFFYRLTR
ncbi:MAG: UbiA family prenyltransferase [Candidatus Kerfeldbacteria bacterium]|nr:UbiA family prenyltransferase [Candidatus Kerfeldbacteria bacterium]